MRAALRLRSLPVYPFARWGEEVAAVQAQGMDVIRLDIGNPDLPPPSDAVTALCRSAQDGGHHGYASFRGLPALRQAVVDYYARRFGVALDPGSQVVPLMGSKEGIVLLALAFLDPGDLVLVPDPGYAPYTMGAALAGAEVYAFPLLASRGFLPDLDAIPDNVADRARLLWLNYPNNPTGATADLTFLAQAVQFAKRHDLLLCYDVPYGEVGYDGYNAPSILQVPGAVEVAVEFNSLSKTFNMAGWRLGMAVGNAAAMGALAQVQSNLDSGIFHPLQEAAIQAFSTPPTWMAERNQIYQQRLRQLVAGLGAVGLEACLPRATFYLWVRVPAGWESERFALALLKETGVAVAPGSFFGPAGEGYVRVSATAPDARIVEAMGRLTESSIWGR